MALRTALNGRPRAWRGSGGECCGLFCFVFTFTFSFALTFSSRGVRGTGVSGCVFTFTFAFAFAFALSFAFAFAFWSGSNWVGEVGFIVKERGAKGPWGCGYVILLGGGVAHLKRERAWSPRALRRQGAGDRWGAAMGWLWELIGSTTVDDLSGKTCVRKLQSTFCSGEFLSCCSNVRARVSEVLGNELTTVGEADDSIEKRKESRGMNGRVDGLG